MSKPSFPSSRGAPATNPMIVSTNISYKMKTVGGGRRIDFLPSKEDRGCAEGWARVRGWLGRREGKEGMEGNTPYNFAFFSVFFLVV